MVLPSVFREGLPRVLLEASAAGKPCVAYNVRGSRDVIEDGKTGYLIKTFDVNSLTDKINQLLDDDDLRKKMSETGQSRIQNNFALENACRSAFEAIESVIKNAE